MGPIEQSAVSVPEIERAYALLPRIALPNGGSSAAAFQPVWTPAAVDERHGEQGYSQSAASQKPWRQGQSHRARHLFLH